MKNESKQLEKMIRKVDVENKKKKMEKCVEINALRKNAVVSVKKKAEEKKKVAESMREIEGEIEKMRKKEMERILNEKRYIIKELKVEKS